MAQALCDLQLELQCQSSKVSLNAVDRVKSHVAADGPVSLAPSTPAVKESKRKREPQKRAEVVAGQNAGNADDSNVDLNVCVRFLEMANAMQLSGTTLVSSVNHENIGNPMSHYPSLYEDSKAYCNNIMGDFPSPKEIARLDEKYLAKRCCLGYRARRILKLAQAVDDGSIKLSKLEELCSEASLTNCNKVDGMLKEINGFGPFTRGNVLMCMGFYNVVPTDSETIRHLKQVCFYPVNFVVRLCFTVLHTNTTCKKGWICVVWDRVNPDTSIWAWWIIRAGKVRSLCLCGCGFVWVSSLCYVQGWVMF